jgi:hypothetical protein
MKIQNLFEAYTSLNYIGTCATTVDDACLWDATEMAQMIENSEPADIRDVLKRISPDSKAMLNFDIHNITEAGNYNYIWWLYDDSNDTHYFFEE